MRTINFGRGITAPDPTYAEPATVTPGVETAKQAKRWRYDNDLGCLIEVRDGMNSEGPEKRLPPRGVISDIDDYVAVGIQDPEGKRGDGLPITGGRRQHRDELRARGLMASS